MRHDHAHASGATGRPRVLPALLGYVPRRATAASPSGACSPVTACGTPPGRPPATKRCGIRRVCGAEAGRARSVRDSARVGLASGVDADAGAGAPGHAKRHGHPRGSSKKHELS